MADYPKPEESGLEVIHRVVREDGSVYTLYRNARDANKPQYVGPMAAIYNRQGS